MTKAFIFEKIYNNDGVLEVNMVLFDKTQLTIKDIVEKEFKTSVKGYKQTEVDKFLDIIIKDYEIMLGEIEELQQENQRLKKQLEESAKRPTPQTAGTTNFDILKRLSNLEKHVFGSKLYD